MTFSANRVQITAASGAWDHDHDRWELSPGSITFDTGERFPLTGPITQTDHTPTP